MENVIAERASPVPVEVLAPPLNLSAEMNQILAAAAAADDVETPKFLGLSAFGRFLVSLCRVKQLDGWDFYAIYLGADYARIYWVTALKYPLN